MILNPSQQDKDDNMASSSTSFLHLERKLTDNPQDHPPPSYEFVSSTSSAVLVEGGPSTLDPNTNPTTSNNKPLNDYKPLIPSPPSPKADPTQPLLLHHGTAGPSNAPAPVVYSYVNPATGERIASLLPPDDPEMVCLQMGHVPQTQFGLLGILAAIFWFPLGIACCLLDRRVRCARCGYVIDQGCAVKQLCTTVAAL
ncbi:hypothetical protein CPB84DRAFT_1963378 [Gymnopilus junonius]|uniref:Brain protein I3 n=1 Tax=Gymnopilus junonius TaxID=109634 RepID=A0A9P5NLS3_GYMJU|nr:hypothetical protein CPB84DRAFT_1963378 [Gymnopilus junonius]